MHLLLLIGPVLADAPPVPACPEGQTEVFRCALEPSEDPGAPSGIAICAEGALSAETLRVLLIGPERTLTFPEVAGPSERSFQYSRYTRPQTTYLSLSFERGGERYTIYDEFEEGEADRGLRIGPPDGEPAGRSCVAETVRGSLLALDDALPPGAD